MRGGSERLHKLIAEGNSLLDNRYNGAIAGLAVPICVSSGAYDAWIANIRAWLDDYCTDTIKGKFEAFIRPNISSVVRVKRILNFLNSLLNSEQ